MVVIVNVYLSFGEISTNYAYRYYLDNLYFLSIRNQTSSRAKTPLVQFTQFTLSTESEESQTTGMVIKRIKPKHIALQSSQKSQDILTV